MICLPDSPFEHLLRSILPPRLLQFFVGLHHPGDGQHFTMACISVRALWRRKKPIPCPRVLVDSGAFTELNLYGRYRAGVDEYADELYRLFINGIVNIAIAVAQDYMCEPFMLAKTGLTVEEHQRLTVERYDALVDALDDRFGGRCPFPIMPVLQGYSAGDYLRHIEMYGDRLKPGMWVGVGSVCKRNGSPDQIIAVLSGIVAARPDLRLHGFGIKLTSLKSETIRNFLFSADSMAWSFAARKQGRDANSWLEAKAFADRVDALSTGV